MLFESAVGFALFRVSGAEVIGMEVDAVQVRPAGRVSWHGREITA